jgi:iron complex outermembrane receptor protein
MKSLIGLGILMFFCITSYSQHTIKVLVKNEDTKEPLQGASVIIPSLNKGASTDSLGFAILNNLPAGNFEIQVSYVGFTTARQKVSLPSGKSMLEIELEKINDEDNPEVVVTATRTDRSIRNTPTRVEVIAGGEISENVSMRPGEIRMLLNETTGIITQQTSAVSNTASLRIQELDGRYTQMLRDGFPLYSGLSEGLSIVQIAPLDLKQVEVIKGSSSTLYGGGAIAGLINLVSKTPTDKRDLSFLANGTSAGGLDLSGFYAERYGKAGITIFASRNSGNPHDPANIGLTAIPKFERYTITPRFFAYGKNTSLTAGISFVTEDRLGGNMNYVKYATPGYFEENNSNRFNTQFELKQKINDHSLLDFKNSYNHFRRAISLPSYEFEGLQQSSFSEISLNAGSAKSQWIAGINLYTDDFNETLHGTIAPRDYHNNTIGAFVQNTWSPAKLVSIETGLRSDYIKPYGFALLPRISALFSISDNLTSRIGAGLGYKTPTIFTDQSEEQHFENILPLDPNNLKYEASAGINADLNYKFHIDEVNFYINPLFFYTRVNDPLILEPVAGGKEQFKNANGYIDSKGVDMSFHLSIHQFKFYTGYSYTIAENHFNGITSTYPLAPKHKLHFDLVYEQEGKLRIAFESYHTGTQQLSDGKEGKQYWLIGALIERSWKHFSIFLNAEDLNDARQTKWDTIYTGTIDDPTFRDIYAPLEGRIINGGVKVKL